MPSLEYVVRPYTSPNVHGQIIIPSSPGSTRGRATITWGAKATNIPVVDPSITVTCCNQNTVEHDRESTRHRIYQNDDKTSPNWVDVDRPLKLHMKKREKNSCDAAGWDDVSGVAAAIDETLGEWDEFFSRFDEEDDPGTCKATFQYSPKPGKITAVFT